MSSVATTTGASERLIDKGPDGTCLSDSELSIELYVDRVEPLYRVGPTTTTTSTSTNALVRAHDRSERRELPSLARLPPRTPDVLTDMNYSLGCGSHTRYIS